MATTVSRLREPTVGEMRDRLIFQRNTKVKDGQGGHTDVWSEYAVLWGRVLPLSSHAMFIARQLENRQDHQIVIRYSLTSKQINSADRIWMTGVNGERTFVVDSTRDLGNGRRFTEVLAHEETQEGES